MHNRTVRRAAAAVPPALLFCAHLTPAVSAASAPEAAEAAAPSAIDRLAHLLVQGEPLLWMLPLALLIALAGISIIRPLLTHGIEKRQLFSFPKCNNCWHGCMCLV